jgi:hypothetical protein
VGRLQKIWSDAVWSKVIAQSIIDAVKLFGGFVVVGAIGSYFVGWWPFSRDIPQNTITNTTKAGTGSV